MKSIKTLLAHPSLIIFAPVTAVLFNVRVALLFLFFLILTDLFYGIKKSFKKKELSFNIFKRHFWKVINSEGLRMTWRKATEYGLGIIVAAFVEGIFFPNFTINLLGSEFSILLFVIAVACIIEIYSIFENLNEINTENGINKIINFIKKYFKAYVSDVLNKIKSGK